MTHPADPAAIRAALDRLAATVAGMTPGEWSTDPETCCIYATDSGRLLTIRDGCEGTGADLHGAIVLRSAADALIDVARRAADYTAARAEIDGLIDSRIYVEEEFYARRDAALLALDAALAALAAAVPGAGDGA